MEGKGEKQNILLKRSISFWISKLLVYLGMELEQIKELVQSKVKTRADVAKEIGIGYSTLNRFLKNEAPKKSALNLLKQWAEKEATK